METTDLLIQLLKETNEKLDKVLVQTTKTNGRVNAIEEWKESVDESVNELRDKSNVNKGRDGVVWYIILAAAAIIWYVAQNSLTLKK
jgi:hypothetical protein